MALGVDIGHVAQPGRPDGEGPPCGWRAGRFNVPKGLLALRRCPRPSTPLAYWRRTGRRRAHGRVSVSSASPRRARPRVEAGFVGAGAVLRGARVDPMPAPGPAGGSAALASGVGTQHCARPGSVGARSVTSSLAASAATRSAPTLAERSLRISCMAVPAGRDSGAGRRGAGPDA